MPHGIHAQRTHKPRQRTEQLSPLLSLFLFGLLRAPRGDGPSSRRPPNHGPPRSCVASWCKDSGLVLCPRHPHNSPSRSPCPHRHRLSLVPIVKYRPTLHAPPLAEFCDLHNDNTRLPRTVWTRKTRHNAPTLISVSVVHTCSQTVPVICSSPYTHTLLKSCARLLLCLLCDVQWWWKTPRVQSSRP